MVEFQSGSVVAVDNIQYKYNDELNMNGGIPKRITDYFFSLKTGTLVPN